MCQNLGATEGVDPFSPEAGNHGAKYQWGAKTGEVGRYVSQADDQSKDGDISGWENYKNLLDPGVITVKRKMTHVLLDIGCLP